LHAAGGAAALRRRLLDGVGPLRRGGDPGVGAGDGALPRHRASPHRRFDCRRREGMTVPLHAKRFALVALVALAVPAARAETPPCVVTVDMPCVSTSNRPGPTADLFNFYTAQVGVFWNVFDFGRSFYGARAAKENEAASTRAAEATLLQVALDVKTGFYGA